MIILNADDLRKALPMPDVIQAMKRAYAALSDGRAQVPLRTHLPIPPHDAVSIFMPAFVDADQDQALVVKAVSLFPNNPTKGLAFIQAAVLVLDSETGCPLALLEGSRLTAIRTGAASGAATDLLARPDSHTVAIFGAGAQGRTQLEAVSHVREIQTVWVYDTNPNQIASFIQELAGSAPIPADIRPARTAQQAVRQADIFCTATTSSIPVFSDADLKPGVHINAIGAYTPEMQEVPPETVARALVVVDSRLASLAEAGDLIQPIQQRIISPDHIHAEIGELVLGRKTGRTSKSQVTLFKSVGVAVQDAMAAQLALKKAQEMGLGQVVKW